ALVRLGRLEDLASLSQLAEWLGQPRATPAAGQPAPARPALAVGPRPVESAPPSAAVKKKSQDNPELPGARASQKPSPESLPQIWQEVLNHVGPMLASALRKAQLPAIFGPNTLVLHFPSSYNSERQHCQQPANVARVEEAL